MRHRLLASAVLACAVTLGPLSSVLAQEPIEPREPRAKRAAPQKSEAKSEAKASQPRAATGGSATLTVINMCAPITHLTGVIMGGAHADVTVDGKKLGSVGPCSYQSFQSPAGDREVIVNLSGFGLAAALGIAGPRHQLASGRTTYIGAVYRQYFETREMSASDAQKAMQEIAAIRKK